MEYRGSQHSTATHNDNEWARHLLPTNHPANYAESPNTVDLATYLDNCKSDEPFTLVRPVSPQKVDLLQWVINETIGDLPDLPLDTLSSVCEDLIDGMVKDHGIQPFPTPAPTAMETDEWAGHDDDLSIFNWSTSPAPCDGVPVPWTQDYTQVTRTMRSPVYAPDLEPSSTPPPASDDEFYWDPDYTEAFNALSPRHYTTSDVTDHAQPAASGDKDQLNKWLPEFNNHCLLSSLVNNVSNVQVGGGRKRVYVDDGQVAGPSRQPDRGVDGRILPPPGFEHLSPPVRDAPPPSPTSSLSTPSPLPTRGVDDDFVLLRFQPVYADKFRFSISDYSLKINDPVTVTTDVEFQTYLKRVLQRVLDVIKPADMHENTVLRLVISIAGMTNPVSIPFTAHDSITVDLLLTFLQNQCQSNSEFSITDELIISVQRAERLGNGGAWWYTRGPNKCTQLLLDGWLDAKASCVRIKNKDNLCLARCLVVGKALADKNADPKNVALANKYTALRNGERITVPTKRLRGSGIQPCGAQRSLAQRDAAVKLHADANVREGVCGLDEIKAFQTYLTDYQILVYSAEAAFQLVFKGEVSRPKQIYILAHNGHYDVITTVAGFFCAKHFCVLCCKTHTTDTHFCTGGCCLCKSPQCSSSGHATTKCHVCNLYFCGAECLGFHLASGLCGMKKRCVNCGFIDTDKLSCNMIKCRICKKIVKRNAHLCYIQCETTSTTPEQPLVNGDEADPDLTTPSPSPSTSVKPEFITWDVETKRDSAGKHSVCWVAAQHSDGTTFGFNTANDFFDWVFKEDCGFKAIAADDPPPAKKRRLSKKEKPQRILVAHYSKGFDSYFALQYLLDHHMKPAVLFNGSKLLSMEIDVGDCSYKFIDSHSFMPAKLMSLSKMWGLPDQKGYFPFRMYTDENKNYVGSFPPLHYFEPETFSPADKAKLEQWHAIESARYDADPTLMYNLHEEMVKYCVNDVTVLRQACQKFQELFQSVAGFDPLATSITLPSACHKAYRRNWMEPDTLAVIPALNYRKHRRDSVLAQQWLAWRAHKDGINYRHARSNGGEKKIGPYYVNGYNEEKNIVLEFYGSYYHGDPEVYGPLTTNNLMQCTMGELHANTLEREDFLRSQGYTVISMWESRFKKMLASNPEMREFASFVPVYNQKAVAVHKRY